MSTSHPSLAMAEKEHELQATAVRVALLRARLASATSQRTDLADLLGEGDDGLPLAMVPLTAALVGAIAANGALFFSYVIYLTRFHETVWNALVVLSMVLGVGSLPFSSRAGAGGRARRALRRFAFVGLLIALVGLLVAFARR